MIPLLLKVYKGTQLPYLGSDRQLLPYVEIMQKGLNDFYIAPLSEPDSSGEIQIKLKINPLLIFARIGILLMLLSAIFFTIAGILKEKQPK
jgi:cytochrome c biogenesis factor